MNKLTADSDALLGVIMLDTQFPRIKGDIGNPDTFDFKVIYECVAGATAKRVVQQSDPALLQPFIAAAKKLEQRGVKMIATSCGFLAMFQNELNAAVSVPVLSSSLLQLHSAKIMISDKQRVGIMTVSADSLSEKHFSALGASYQEHPIIGLNPDSEFASVFLNNKLSLDQQQCTQEMVACAKQFVQQHPDIGAIVLECTNMPPYAQALREATNLPIFDVVTMLNYAKASLAC